jgi:hypothetical protein
MSDSKTCPLCNSPMASGRLQQTGNYGNSPFVWAPEGEPPFAMKGAPSQRVELLVYRCTACGYLQWFAPPK